ncbi:hypothetical protein BCR33DRAFT_713534 [Rhizoclosmatium globosum]|uniref:Cache domain-containing protein n=1 Tax=Rhizoclosmatium globosum TaxID=329046 RepID=A0A1Y2CUC9_9FUNG|nr:hypothetical protein BCR33DRAFT_713534 [Rhizoclosmatium globosum]|eukprot:ORY49935.1 hypothetical protein BCR33DRAFT_713534 [Rhizoclosmatium globosum]
MFLLPPAQSAPLKHHLLYWFILCALVSLFFSEAIAVGFIGGSLFSLTNTASSLLTTQASNALASSIVSNSAQLFEDALADVIFAMTASSTAIGDTYRQDYSTGYEPSFYGYNATSNGKFTPPPLNYTTNSTLNKVAHVDTFIRPLYKLSPNVLSVQIGFDDSGLFKSYPGTGDNLNLGTYDPRTRSWYQAALKNQASPSSFAIANPYLSAFGRGWVLTTSKVFYNKVDGTVAGVISIQSQLSEFSKLLSSFTVSGSNVAVFTADPNGYVVASTKIKFDDLNPSPTYFSYKNTSSPTFSDSLWNQIISSSSSSFNTQTSNFGSTTFTDPQTNIPYLILWKTLSIYASDAASKSGTPSWVAVGSVPISQLQTIVDTTTANLKKSVPLSIGISVGVFAGTTLIVLLLVIVFANQIVKPLALLSAESSRVSNNIGGKDLWEGVNDKDVSRSGVDEMDKFKDSFYEMVFVKAVVEHELPSFESVEVQSILDLLPDEPPQYEEADPNVYANARAPAGGFGTFRN